MKPLINPSLMCMDLLSIRDQIAVLKMSAEHYVANWRRYASGLRPIA